MCCYYALSVVLLLLLTLLLFLQLLKEVSTILLAEYNVQSSAGPRVSLIGQLWLLVDYILRANRIRVRQTRDEEKT